MSTMFIAGAKRERSIRHVMTGLNWPGTEIHLVEAQLADQRFRAHAQRIERAHRGAGPAIPRAPGRQCAPWYVVPADKKWFRNLAVSQIVGHRLESMDLKYPKPAADPVEIKFE
jgi:hypothetical protein